LSITKILNKMIKTILLKDIKLFLSDKKSVLMTFLLPILLISLFAFAFGGIGSDNNQPKIINLLITDLDKSQDTKTIITALDSISGVKLIPTKLEKATNLVKKGKYLGVLVFKKGLKDSLNENKSLPIELKYDAAREIEISMLQSVIMQKLMETISKKLITNNINSYLDKEFSGITANMKNRIANSIKNNQNTDISIIKMTSVLRENNKNKTNLGLIQAVSGTAIMMLLFSIAGIGGGLLDEKEAGTLKRLFYSPIKPSTILFGKMGAALIIAIAQLIIMFLFSWIAFKLPIFKDLPSLILMILATAFAVSSFGIFLVSITKTRQQLNGLSTIIIMLMSAIGGSMIPLFVMPSIMQKIAVISVNYWGIQGFYDIFWRSLPLIEIAPRLLVLIGIGLFMTIISIFFFKKNMLKLV